MTHEQLEAILIPKYTEALNLGTEVLLSMNADNEDDEEHNDDETQETPENKEKKPKTDKEKNIFAKHPLPAIIGTKEFNEDDYCGLVVEEEIEDIDLEEPEPEHISIGAGLIDEDGLAENEDVLENYDEPVAKNALMESDEEEENEEQQKEQNEKEPTSEEKLNNKISFGSELAAKIGKKQIT